MNKHAPILNKVILYYGFTPISDPDAILLWQKLYCDTCAAQNSNLSCTHDPSNANNAELIG